MKIKSLEISNFMSIKEAKTNLADKGLVLVQGNNEDDDSFESNGSGKSTIFTEAIVWALFGKTIRGLSGDAVVNRHVKKNTMVTITLAEGSDEYVIQRARKYAVIKNKVLVHHNGTEITAKSDADTNNLIEDILQMDYLSFTNSIIFGQGLSKMFASSTDTEQKKILERMLQIGILQECQELAKSKRSLVALEKGKLERSIVSTSESRVVLENNLSDLQAKEAELGEKISKRIEEFNASLKETHDAIAETEARLPQLEEDKSVFESAIKKQDELMSKYTTDEKEYDKLGYRISEINSKLDNVERQLVRTNKSLEDAKNGINIPSTCSKCGQKIEPKDNSHIIKHLEEQLEGLDNEAQELENERVVITDKRLKLRPAIVKLDKVKTNKQKYTDEFHAVKMEINSIGGILSSYRRSITNLESRIKEQQDLASKTYTDLIESAIGALRENDEQMSQLHSELQKQEEEFSLLDFWVNAYGNQGIKSVLLDSVVPVLNARANYYIGKLSGSSIEIKFHTQELVKSTGKMKDKFYVEVINHNGDDNYKGNSGGEKRRVDIAINMALQDLVQSRSNKRFDLIVYDEMWEGLDDVGCESAIELLREKAEEFGSVFVITHSAYLQKLFSNVVTVTKTNGETTIEEV